MQQKTFGAIVAYVSGGQRLNAFVLMSHIHLVNGKEEEVLDLKVPDPSQAARVMNSSQLEQALSTKFGVRPLSATKPANEDHGTGTGWVDTAEATSDTSIMKDGPLLQDLVHEINSGNPVDAYGKDLKQNEKFVAAAKHCGVELTPVNTSDVHAQIVREIQHEGLNVPKPFTNATAPIASPEIATGDSNLKGGGKSQQDISDDKQALMDSSKASEVLGKNTIGQAQPSTQGELPEETQDAIDRGELNPVAMNSDPETHPEFGNTELTGEEKFEGEKSDDGTGYYQPVAEPVSE